MKIHIFFFMIIFSLSACSPSERTNTINNQLTWRSLSQAKGEALAKNKPMLVDFFTSQDCHRCQDLITNIYSDSTIVSRINRDFVPVRVVLDNPLSPEEKFLAERLESGEECILAFLSPKGDVITDSEGKKICSMDLLDPKSFNNYLDNALQNLKKTD